MKHLISIKRRSVKRAGEKPMFRAQCNCGWSGSENEFKHIATQDGNRHTSE